MKRERKYRIWDREENKFFSPIYEAYKGNLLDLSISLSGELIRRTIDLPAEHESCFPDRYIIEDWTGLKDNNCKEIYEGDILEYPIEIKLMYNPHYSKKRWLEEVYYSIASGSFNIEVDWVHECEVIGNIHENPELL